MGNLRGQFYCKFPRMVARTWVQCAYSEGRANLCGISVGGGFLGAIGEGGQFVREQLARDDCIPMTESKLPADCSAL
jgi:hypothetical protein